MTLFQGEDDADLRSLRSSARLITSLLVPGLVLPRAQRLFIQQLPVLQALVDVYRRACAQTSRLVTKAGGILQL